MTDATSSSTLSSEPGADFAPKRGTRSRPDESKIRVLAGLLTVTVVSSVLVMGTVHVRVLLVIASLAAVAGVLAVRRGVAPGAVLPPPVLVTLFLAAYCALQAVPLPVSWLNRAAPHNVAVWMRTAELLGDRVPVFASLALDPGAALVESLKWLAYASVFVLAAVVGRHRGLIWITELVFGTAVLTAAVTVAHGLMGLRRVYGLYTATFEPYRWSVGPLLNTNNLAGYLNLGVLAGIGLLLSRRGRIPKLAVAFGIATIIGVSLVAASRAGFAALAVGTAILWAASSRELSANGNAGRQYHARNVLAAVLGGGAVLALLGSNARTWREVFDDRFDKVKLLIDIRHLVADHPWFGIGRGAFESVFPAYASRQRNLVYAHAENFVAEWVAEWGIPVAIVALVCYGWTLRPSELRARRSFLTTSVFVSVAVLLAQNIFDLALEVPGVVIALTTVLGGAWGHAHASSETGASRLFVQRVRRFTGWALAVAAIAAIALVGTLSLHPTGTDRRILAGQFHRMRMDDRGGARELLFGAIRDCIRRHPADPYFPRVAALIGWIDGENPMPWLQYALERDLDSGQTHLLTARVLVARGAWSQSLMELRLASTQDAVLARPAARIATSITHDDSLLLRAAGDGAVGGPMLTNMASLLDRGASRYRLLQEAIRRDPAVVQPRQVLSTDYLAAIETNTEPCNAEHRKECERAVASEIRAINAAGDADIAGTVAAQLLIARGQYDDAERFLMEHCPTARNRIACLTLRVKAAAHGTSQEKLTGAADALTTEACLTPVDCATTCLWLGGIFGNLHRWDAATRFVERAAQERPSPDAWLRVSSVATQAGQHARAADALEQAARLGASGTPKLRDEAQQRILRELLAR